MRIVFLSFLIVVMSVPLSKSQAAGRYIGLSVGYELSDDLSFSSGSDAGSWLSDNGYNISFVYGKEIIPFFRGELELSFAKSDLSSVISSTSGNSVQAGSLKVSSIMLNGYYDFALSSTIKPYLTIGIGLNDISVDREGTSAAIASAILSIDDKNYSSQAGLGLSYQISPTFSLVGDYRWYGASSYILGYFDNDNYSTSRVKVGVRFHF